MMQANEQNGRQATLSRTLTLVPATALIVTNVVGTGIFTKTRVMTCNVGSPLMVMLAFASAGLLTLAGALTFAELGAMLPRSGGHYNYIQAAFGRLWAFLFGWMETLLDGAASVAAIAMVFAMFLNDLTGDTLSPSLVLIVTLLTIGATTLLASASMHANGLVVATVTVMKVLLVLGIGLAAFFATGGAFAHFSGDVIRGTEESAISGRRNANSRGATRTWR